MYHIIIDNEAVQTTDKQHIAWANYRSLCRDYQKKTQDIKLMSGDKLLHHKQANQRWLDDFDSMTANDVFKTVVKTFDYSPTQIKSMLEQQGFYVSKSRVNGWYLASDKKDYKRIHNDELCVVFQSIINNQLLSGYTPDNLATLVAITRLSKADFVRQFGLKESTFFNNLTAVDKSSHRSMSYKSWLELNKKVNDFLLKTQF